MQRKLFTENSTEGLCNTCISTTVGSTILREFRSKKQMTSPNPILMRISLFFHFFRRPVRTTRRPKALVSSTTSNPDYEYEYYYDYEEYEDEDYKGIFILAKNIP